MEAYERMNRWVLVFCVVLLCASSLPAIHAIGSSQRVPYAAPPSRITLTFPAPTVVRRPEFGDYVKLELPDCHYLTAPGRPALPVKTVTIKINRGYTVSAVAVEVARRTLAGTYNVTPAYQPTPTGREGGISPPDPEVYQNHSWFPGPWFEYRTYTGIDPTTLAQIKYLVIHVYPLQYIPAAGKVVKADSAVLSIAYSGSVEETIASMVDLAIITSPDLVSQADSLGEWKNQTGVITKVVTTEWIYAHYTGSDNPEKIRNYITDTYHTLGIKFALIFGDADQVPVRYAYIPDGAYDDNPDVDGVLVETDLYYADLQYTWNEREDDRWGEFSPGKSDQVDGVPDLYVGRLPASTTEEASVLVNKITHYCPPNEWFMKCLLLGTDPFKGYAGAEGEILKNYIRDNFVWANFSRTILYETAGNLTVEDAEAKIDDGYGFVNFAGHGDYNLWSFEASGIYTNAEALSQDNGDRTSVLFVMACLTARFSDKECLGEAFLLNPNGGGIAYYGASRISWGYTGTGITEGLAGEMDWRFWEALFDGLNQSRAEEPYTGAVWGNAITRYIEAHGIHTRYVPGGYYLDWKTVAEYGTLLGDPTLYLKGRYNIRVSVSPTSVGTGMTQWFYMSVENGGQSQHGIWRVELPLPLGWEAKDGYPPEGWTCEVSTDPDAYVWETFSSDAYIGLFETLDGFNWQATTPTAGGEVTMTVTTTATNSETETDTFEIMVTVPEYPLGLAAVFAPSLFMYLFLKEMAGKD
jgi:hypothetical protein